VRHARDARQGGEEEGRLLGLFRRLDWLVPFLSERRGVRIMLMGQLGKEVRVSRTGASSLLKDALVEGQNDTFFSFLSSAWFKSSMKFCISSNRRLC
jgi:hypothetical protein